MGFSQNLVRTYYLAFGYSDKWYDRVLIGYTHVALVYVNKHGAIGLNPLLNHCHLELGGDINFMGWDCVLRVRVKPSRKNRLFKLQFQTCVSFVQYVMGIDTGAILAQTLFDRLLNKEYSGVEVILWHQNDISILD